MVWESKSINTTCIYSFRTWVASTWSPNIFFSNLKVCRMDRSLCLCRRQDLPKPRGCRTHTRSCQKYAKYETIITRIPQTLVNCPLQKSSGLRKGSITNSFSVSFTFSRAPISSNVTPMSLGGITSPKSLFSNSFSVTTS